VRYSIIGATVAQVQAVGGADIKATRMGIIFATLTLAQVGQLLAMGCQIKEVNKVSAPQISPPTPITPITAGVAYTAEDLLSYAGLEQLRGLTDPPLYGENMNIALIDSGVRETHEAVRGLIVYSKNYTSEAMADDFDHGTGNASIIATIAPKANILNLKVLDRNGDGSDEAVVLAIDDCISLHDTQPQIAPLVINLSLGGADDGDPNNILRVACREAISRGILIAAAAGNSGPAAGTICTPACERYVGAVGSCRVVQPSSFAVSNFSSRGPTLEGLVKPDAVLFGESISMASSTSDTAVVVKSGTSFAAPFGSGIILMFEEGILRHATYPGGVPKGFDPTVEHLFNAQGLLDTWTPRISTKPSGLSAMKDNSYGYGLPIGDLILKAMQGVPTVDLSSILAPMVGIMAMGMVGMVVSSSMRNMARRS